MPMTEKEIWEKTQKEVEKEFNEMVRREEEGKKSRQERKKEIAEKSLHDLLYNGGKPKSTDIVQRPDNRINYFVKQYGIDDCTLLTELIHLAKTKSNFITNSLINTKTGNPNRVEVNLFHYGYRPLPPNMSYASILNFYPCAGCHRLAYVVTKDEAVKWKSAHRAFWPIVIEIAYSKFLKDACIGRTEYVKNCIEALQKIVENSKPESKEKTEATEELQSLSQKLKSLSYINSLPPKELLGVNDPMFANVASAHAALTGKSAKAKTFTIRDMFIFGSIPDLVKEKENAKAFGVYSSSALRLYEKIKNKLQEGKMIAVSFRDKNKENQLIRIEDKRAPIARALDDLTQYTTQPDKLQEFSALVLKEFSTNITYFSNGEVSPEEFSKKTTKQKLELINKILADSREMGCTKLSKSKIGIHSHHAYAVVGCREHDGYKYIIIANPHGTMTKIDYARKTKKLVDEGRLPKVVENIQNIDNAHGECAMELNHFYKKISSIEYEYDPEEKKRRELAYEALRNMLK